MMIANTGIVQLNSAQYEGSNCPAQMAVFPYEVNATAFELIMDSFANDGGMDLVTE
jgi:hypothetical protein